MATETPPQNGQDSTPESSFEKRQKRVREWLDISAKFAIAATTLWLTIIANNYQQKASVVTLLSQRETAESELRTSMLKYLIEPFVVQGEKTNSLDAKRSSVLLSLLALNFHDHIELKPLLVEVDAKLQNGDQVRQDLRSVARRVVDRQIAMLTGRATNKKEEGTLKKIEGTLKKIFHSEPSQEPSIHGSVYTLYFKQEEEATKKVAPRMLLAVEDNKPISTKNQLDKKDQLPDKNGDKNPAMFSNNSGSNSLVCAPSPNNKYALAVGVTRDPVKETVNVSTFIAEEDKACNRSINDTKIWRPLQPLTLSPYDFPLTDNVAVDSSQRFALAIYDNTAKLVALKLIWFPEGYITERDRPMNYDEVNRTLGVS